MFSQLASQILSSLTRSTSSGPFASNWLERLRYIKRIQAKIKSLDSQGIGFDSVLIRGSGNGGHAPSATAGRSRVQTADFTKYA